MLEELLSLLLHLVELRLTLVDDILLSVKVLTGVFKFVACALILALLLIELELALFHLCFYRLQFRHFLLSLFFSFRSDFKSLFTAFKHLVPFEVLGFTLRLGNNEFCPGAGHAALNIQRDTRSDGSGDSGNSDVNKKLHILINAIIKK